MSELTVSEKRELIYVGERLKVLANEQAALKAQHEAGESLSELSEDQKRQNIYMAERLVRLSQERSELLESRKTLSDKV